MLLPKEGSDREIHSLMHPVSEYLCLASSPGFPLLGTEKLQKDFLKLFVPRKGKSGDVATR